MQRNKNNNENINNRNVFVTPGYSVQQHNIVVDALGGYSASVRSNIKQLFSSRGDSVLRRVQKAVILGTLFIVRKFKIATR